MLQEGGEDASLIIAANERLGLQELLRSDLRAPIVYMSACLVGRTREDADGDPLGLGQRILPARGAHRDRRIDAH
jgi:hypothetical protein